MTAAGLPLAQIEAALASNTDDCIPWPFAMTNAGYGKLWVTGRCELAHREVCKRAHGEAPFLEAEAAHSCGNGHFGCINPRHLSWKTAKQNSEEMVEHGHSRRGEIHHNAKLTHSDIPYIRADPDRLGVMALGRKFGVTHSAIQQIQRRRNWGWVP